jgi:hypothetical protein
MGPFKVKEPLGLYSSSKVIKGTVYYTLFLSGHSLLMLPGSPHLKHLFSSLLCFIFWLSGLLYPMREARPVEVQ